jgi:hypothetical protein
MPMDLPDPALRIVSESLQQAKHHADSLSAMLQLHEATRDYWIAIVQQQTTIFSVITGGLVALLVAVNWGWLAGKIRAASRAEAGHLERKLAEITKDLHDKTDRAAWTARKDSLCLWVGFATQNDDFGTATVTFLNAAVYFALLGNIDMAKDYISQASKLIAETDPFTPISPVVLSALERDLRLLDGKLALQEIHDLIGSTFRRVTVVTPAARAGQVAGN